MNIQLEQGADELVLNGPGVAGPVKAARFEDGGMTVLDVALEGTPAAIAAGVSEISRYLAEGARTFKSPAEDWVYISATLADGSTWRSPVHGGDVQLTRGAAGRKLNTQGVRIELAREPWWEESALDYAALSNGHGSSAGAGGLVVYNHNDSGHDNYVDVDDVGGDLPAPAVLSMTGSGMGGVEAWCGLAAYAIRDDLVSNFEGESGSSQAGVTPTISADAGCSGGSYASLAWSGTAEVRARSWGVSATASGAFNGRVYRPLLRLQSAIAAGEKFWLTLMIGYNYAGTVEPIYRSEGVLIPESRLAVELPAVQLPPWPVMDGISENMEVCLMVQAEAASAHTLALDFLGFWPSDSFLHFSPAVSSYPNFDIEYNTESVLMKNAGRSFASHITEGTGIWLTPGREQRLAFAFRQGAGWDITHAPVVNLEYRKRKQAL